jgi:hypothetical protein
MEMWFVVMQVERSISRSNGHDVDDVCRSDLKATDVQCLLLCLTVDGVQRNFCELQVPSRPNSRRRGRAAVALSVAVVPAHLVYCSAAQACCIRHVAVLNKGPAASPVQV